ncbi:MULTISPECIES: AAA family ATPase [Odoribacteraceae]|uniref:AAA family ATPase n=1 Tax=Odoribacteraceae TaxID=1853231 RepID=UPI000E5172AD|nr:MULTISPECIES: AAA family ATPase [Odoribacteraceae]MCQ4874981.1 AAA family ATPase [Butyricimonas paravirosa]RHR82963.1 AAA family ATPase [Odoribacter sp. AF15-53]
MAGKSKSTKTAVSKAASNINFKFKSIQTSSSEVIDFAGDKHYRTVFRLNEVETLFVDTEFINKQFDEKSWEAEIVAVLFYMNGKQPVAVAQKGGKIVIPETESLFHFTTTFSAEDFTDFTFREGVYRAQIVINGEAGLSDEIHFLEPHDYFRDYFKLLDVGFDKCVEEAPDVQRPHSYRALAMEGLTDVRFYLVAENYLAHEWTYEFIINIFDTNGRMKASRVAKGNYYIPNRDGKRLLCFAIDLGAGLENFWTEGEYKVELLCFDQSVMQLKFVIGDQDIPYDFSDELAIVNGVSKDTSTSAEIAPQDKEEALSSLYQLVGLRRVKEEITRIYELAEFVKMRQENGFSDKLPLMNMVFMGNPGTGKHTVAEITGKIFYHLGVLANGKVHQYRREDFTRPGYTMEEQLIREAVTKCLGGVLFIEDADELYPTNDPNDPAIRIFNTLLNILEQEQPALLVIMAGDSTDLQALASGIPGMKKCFPNQFVFDDYTADELMDITRQMLIKRQFKFTPEAEDKFFDMLKDCCTVKDSGFSNGRFIEDRLEDAASRMAKRLMTSHDGTRSKEDMMLIQADDIETFEEPDPNKSLDLFNEMIGSNELKNSLISYINYVYFIRERQKHGYADVVPPLHMLFTGNRGTGKTTVARMLGEIFESAGILETSNVIVRSRGEIVGDGSIPPQQIAMYIFEQARGGILFLEDAHTLFQDNVGAAALGVIFSQLSPTDNGDTIVILSGDPDEMEKALASNPKVKTLFPYHFHFADYTPDELMEIAVQKIAEKNYTLHPKAKEAFNALVTQVCEERDKYFGNALFVEKMVDKAIHNLSARTMKIRKERELTRKEITTLMAADIPAATSELPNSYKDTFDEKEIAAALKDLDHMVGQAKMKKQIHDFVNLARHYNQQGIKLNTRLSLQWCFTGNSGMGKGTVARIIARIYKAMGIVDKGVVTSFKVERLIGLTEEDAVQSIGMALLQSKGGLFFFDEDSSSLNEIPGFRDRVRAILVNQLATQPGAYNVIYAKQDPPRQIINDEVEKVSDMINILVFEDYTEDQLMEILKRDLATDHTRMTRTAQQHMKQFISYIVTNKKRSHASARLVKLVAEMMIRNRVQRLAKNGKIGDTEHKHSITMQDVEMFTPTLLDSMISERNTIGYKQ